MKKYLLMLLLILGLLTSVLWAGGVTLEPSKGLTVISWLNKNIIKVALITKEDKNCTISIGTYDLRPIIFDTKKVSLKKNKINLLEFKPCTKKIENRPSVNSSITADTIFVYDDKHKNPVAMSYIQELHKAVGYYHCDNYLLPQGKKANIVLNLENKPKESLFLIKKTPQLQLKSHKDLKLADEAILKKFPPEIKDKLKENWALYGTGVIHLVVNSSKISEDIYVFSPQIQHYNLVGRGYAGGGLSTAVILIYNPAKYEVVKL